jgi:hypothetical protein
MEIIISRKGTINFLIPKLELTAWAYRMGPYKKIRIEPNGGPRTVVPRCGARRHILCVLEDIEISAGRLGKVNVDLVLHEHFIEL